MKQKYYLRDLSERIVLIKITLILKTVIIHMENFGECHIAGRLSYISVWYTAYHMTFSTEMLYCMCVCV